MTRRLRTGYTLPGTLRLIRYPSVLATVVAAVLVAAAVHDVLRGWAGFGAASLVVGAGGFLAGVAVERVRDREAARRWTDPRPPWEAVTDQVGESRLDRNVKRFFVELHRAADPTHVPEASY